MIASMGVLLVAVSGSTGWTRPRDRTFGIAPLSPFITGAVMVDEISSSPTPRPGVQGDTRKPQPLPRSSPLSAVFAACVLPSPAVGPTPQTPPVSQLRRESVHVYCKADDHDQLTGFFGPFSALKVPSGHDTVEAESHDRKCHQEYTSDAHSF